MSYQANPARPGTGSVDSRRIHAPAFGPITTFASLGESTQLTAAAGFNKRLSRGFTIFASYTRSRFIDIASGDGDGGSNPFDLSGDRGTSDLDVPHVFVGSFVYDLPKLQTAHAAIRHTFGGWQTTGIVLLRSGTPFSGWCSGRDNSQSGVNLDRTDLVGDPDLPGDRSRGDIIEQYFNTAAFAQNPGWHLRHIKAEPDARAGIRERRFRVVQGFPGTASIAANFSSAWRSSNLLNRQNLGIPMRI